MSMFRLGSQSVRFSSVRFTSSARISDGPKNLLVLGSGLSHFVGTRHYTVTRIQDYMFWPVKKCLSCVTFFTGRFETVPFTHQRLYVFPSLEKIDNLAFFRLVKKLNKNALVYPQTHPLCVRVESIAIKILEVLQRETGRHHKLADRQWLLKYDGTLKVVKKIREENVKSTSDHLKEGIDWEFMVVDSPVTCFCHSSQGKILVSSGWFDVCKTDDELAIIIATEVGHVVARHVQREFFSRHPCIILYHLIINGNNPVERHRLSNEHEADYIGMLLSASAGYDPRVGPVALQKKNAYQHNFHLKERVKYISQPEVMQKAVDIYEERRKCKIMSMFRLCNYIVKFSNVSGFESAGTAASLYRFTSSTSLPSVEISNDGPKNLSSGLKFDQKSLNPLSQFAGTRYYSVHRLLGLGFDQELRKPLSHFVGTRHYSVPRIQKYVYRPLMKCLSYVTFFTGKFETTPFTNITVYVFPFIDKIYGEKVFWSWKQACKKGLRLPLDDPRCIQVESVATKILEALQRETGRRHMLADQQWIKDDDDGNVKLVKTSTRNYDKSTNVHLKEGIDWELFVIDHPIIQASAQDIGTNKGKIVLFTGLFHLYKTDEELAIIIAHEIGHVVSRHVQRRLLWLPFKKIYHRVINGYDPEMHYYLRYEHEADYIAMLLFASAGYDPRVAPRALTKFDDCMEFVKYNHLPFARLENAERIEFMTKPEVMQEALRIYQEKT